MKKGKTINRAQIPQAQAQREFNFPRFKKHRLKNGLQVVFAPHTKLPVVSLQIIIKAGANIDEEAKEGLADFTAHMLSEGTKTKSALEISNAFEFLGTNFSAHSDWDATYLEMGCLKKHLNGSMEILSDVLFNPSFPTKEIERNKKQRLNSRMQVADNAGSIAMEKFAQTIFPNTRFSIPLRGRSAEINSFTKQDLQSFYKRYYQAHNATLVITGDLSQQEVTNLVERYLGKWPANKVEQHLPANSTLNSTQKVHFVHKEKAQQAELRIGHLGITYKNEDYFSLNLLNQILGGYFLSRINQNLREDKGYTYGVSSRFGMRSTQGIFLISTAVETEYAFESVHEILKEIERVRNEKISNEELQQAKGYVSGIFPIAFENASQIAAGLSNIVVFNHKEDYYRTFREKINDITVDNVWHAAQKWLHPDKLSIVICADKTNLYDRFDAEYNCELSDYIPDKTS